MTMLTFIAAVEKKFIHKNSLRLWFIRLYAHHFQTDAHLPRYPVVISVQIYFWWAEKEEERRSKKARHEPNHMWFYMFVLSSSIDFRLKFPIKPSILIVCTMHWRFFFLSLLFYAICIFLSFLHPLDNVNYWSFSSPFYNIEIDEDGNQNNHWICATCFSTFFSLRVIKQCRWKYFTGKRAKFHCETCSS